MPELPEVETMCRGIAPVVGQHIQQVEHPPCACRPISISPSREGLRQMATGSVIHEVRRVGKRVVLVLDPGYLIFEPRMTGLVLLADPPNQQHLRLCLKLSDSLRLLFWDRRGLGTVQLLTPDQFEQDLGPARLGPDALQITPAALQERLGSSRRAIKVALLDQKVVAGIGNLYAAEILHVACVHPEQSCDTLRKPQWERIHAATREVLLTAIRYEGSTLGDGTYRNALNQAGSYQSQHRVYAREGETCPTCQTATVVRIVQAQRATFFCPGCQKRSRQRSKR